MESGDGILSGSFGKLSEAEVYSNNKIKGSTGNRSGSATYEEWEGGATCLIR
jgi:hypothetical protein